MRTLFFSFVAAVVLCLCSCSYVPPDAITVERYSQLEYAPKLQAHQFRISCQLVNAQGKVTAMPAITTRPGQPVTVSKMREVRYPTQFNLPKISALSAPNYRVTPTTPTAFASREVGDYLTLSARTRGAFVELSGSLIAESCRFPNHAAGEAVSPISDASHRVLLTFNKVTPPEFTRVESLVYLCGLPGTEQRFHLTAQRRDLVVKCEVIR